MDRTSRRRAGQLISSMKANKRKNNDALPSTVFSNQGSALSNSGTIIVNVISGAKEDDIKMIILFYITGLTLKKYMNPKDRRLIMWKTLTAGKLKVKKIYGMLGVITFMSPEKYHVIECGYSIKCKPSIPQQLYDHLDTATVTINNPFKQHPEYSLAVLEALKPLPKNWKAARKAVVNPEDNDDDDEGEESKEFLQELFLIMQKKDVAAVLKESKASYNLFVFWPLISLAAGEYILKASKEEYRADACILDENDRD
ncbi:uncharacterized protein B0P05DRAFT_585477 [Gilbertella persicaria]|uniref:uncharacterized protein n=1 Tax=Gilbertella persicaria TaxID=101096 RepID=UPI00221F4D85|nr:uncharacterized protein B0P05DRAFT_585477 [Gilbertella persicaria]KAI8085973.1 hypothetical protein B0P05DRAFT_585477 [Gilbertella persicaria]